MLGKEFKYKGKLIKQEKEYTDSTKSVKNLFPKRGNRRKTQSAQGAQQNLILALTLSLEMMRTVLVSALLILPTTILKLYMRGAMH